MRPEGSWPSGLGVVLCCDKAIGGVKRALLAGCIRKIASAAILHTEMPPVRPGGQGTTGGRVIASGRFDAEGAVLVFGPGELSRTPAVAAHRLCQMPLCWLPSLCLDQIWRGIVQ